MISLTLMFFTLKAKNDGALTENKGKCIFLLIFTILLSILCFIFIIINLLNFITNPDLNTILQNRAEENNFDKNLYDLNFLNQTNDETLEGRIEDILEAAKECLTPNIQSRMQTYFRTFTSLMMHSTDTDFFLGLVTDTGFYFKLTTKGPKFSAA
mmetsp:Transcript_32769/g.29058  ORF Transcript_32769/g.29058 Transcript_32769/m.29058 type:complete len:155 (+) Transcript_32769:177-641(+)